MMANILPYNTNDFLFRSQQTAILLGDLLSKCKSARSTLSSAQHNLTTNNLEILATYKKREIMHKLLKTLHTIKQLKSTDRQLQKLLADDNYSEAIQLLLECKKVAAEHRQYSCVEALSQKNQDTMLLTELQLDAAFNDVRTTHTHIYCFHLHINNIVRFAFLQMTHNFDAKKYSKLQDAQKLLGKNVIAIDQLHINFISAIHTTAFTVLKSYIDEAAMRKETFEDMCQVNVNNKY